MSTNVLDKQDKDGGYYAIKGFLYQFDQTLIQILKEPNQDIRFEVEQDIDYDKYVIQVKHKEASTYSPSKVKAAVKQLLELSTLSKNNKYKLYCHFKDEDERELDINLKELDKILGEGASAYEKEIKQDFLRRFTLFFLPNFEKTFDELLNLLIMSYNLPNKELAIYYHAVFRTELSQRSINSREKRMLNKKDLDFIIDKTSKVIFDEGYQKYISHNRYLQLIKKEYFVHKTAHIKPYERIIIIECTGKENKTDLVDIVIAASNKFFRNKITSSHSPAPFICFRGLQQEILISIKQSLIDYEYYFNDGTFFDGDKVRTRELLNKEQNEKVKVRFINEEYLNQLDSIELTETYQFYTKEKLALTYDTKEIGIFIKSIEDIKKIIN